MAASVLLVEDEENLASLVEAYLRQEGYPVIVVTTGAEALRVVGQEPIRLVVLDLTLPDIDGLDVCRQIRTRSTVPIVMVTARDEEADRLVGLDVGADDYIGKPFSPKELVARMKAVLRRTEPHTADEMLVLGDVVVQRDAREVGVAGQPVELRPKEFDLLAYLIQNRGVVVSRDVLLERVWGMDYAGGTRTVDVHVAQLRRKLGRPGLIRTIRGAGYKAVAP
jgi:two-component system, OmpR family, alkaline phosphatase synthesis response regulator PhoP